jgi:hypothetical protein
LQKWIHKHAICVGIEFSSIKEQKKNYSFRLFFFTIFVGVTDYELLYVSNIGEKIKFI